MTERRTYADGCAAAQALDLVGERWALLVVRELLFGPKRFNDLRRGMPQASPNVLSQRLRELEAVGVLRRRKLGPPVGSQVYELTDWGFELEPVLAHLGRWRRRSPVRAPQERVSADALMLALRSNVDPVTAAGIDVNCEVALGEDRFAIRVAGGQLTVKRGEAQAPDAVVDTDADTFRTLLWKRQGIDEAMARGQLRLTGDPAPVQRLLDILPTPRPVPVS